MAPRDDLVNLGCLADEAIVGSATKITSFSNQVDRRRHVEEVALSKAMTGIN